MDPLSNLTSIRGDVIELWDAPAKKYLGIQELIIGIPPASMNTLEKVADAIGNDPDYFGTIAAGLESKADLYLVNSGLAGKADLTLTTNEKATNATTCSVTDLTARIVNTERVVTADPNVTFNYLETGDDALVIRGPNEISANFLGPSSGDLEGRVVFYKDLLLNGVVS